MWIKVNEGKLANLNTGIFLEKHDHPDSFLIHLGDYLLYEFPTKLEREQKFAELERLLIPDSASTFKTHNIKVGTTPDMPTLLKINSGIIPPLTPKQIWENCTEEFKKAFPYFAIDEDGSSWHYEKTPHREDYDWCRGGDCHRHPFPVNWGGDWKDSLHYKGEPVK